MISVEARALLALSGEPPEPLMTRRGDLWHLTDRDDRLSYTMLVLGHKKTSRRRADGHSYLYLYHWGLPSLTASPCNLRDNDANSLQAEASLLSHIARGGKVRHLGNIFEMLPLPELLT